MIIEAYRGCGAGSSAFLMGRAMQAPRGRIPRDPTQRNGWDLLRRFLLRGVRGVTLEIALGGASARATTDRDGYFSAQLSGVAPLEGDEVWGEATIRQIAPQSDPEAAQAQAQVYMAPASARYLVISDIDDTVMHTGVANKLIMAWRLFAKGPESRAAFPGVAAFYRALHAGRSGSARNPMTYISRAPWSIYSVLDAFFNRLEIPAGPVLFLREWGFTVQSPLPRRARGHKRTLIDIILEVHDGLPAILIGDSGQRDPEVYAEVVAAYPGRIAAVYIRDVTGTARRNASIARIQATLAAAKAPLLLTADSYRMAQHAVAHGFLPATALPAIADAAKADKEEGS